MKLCDLVTIKSGIPLFRITETNSSSFYFTYGQGELLADLNMSTKCGEKKVIRTDDKVDTLCAGDIVFSLISGTAAKVHSARAGYLYSQNYAVLVPNEMLDANFLVYLINCSQDIKRQFATSIQGSQVLKYTLNQLRLLEVKTLPDLATQQSIGKIYMAQNRLMAVKTRLIECEQKRLLYFLKSQVK